MKHLKTYKIFEGYDVEVYQTLIDICLDLQDEGYFVVIADDQRHVPRMNISELIINKDMKWFSIKDTKEVIERVSQYLGDSMRGIYYRGGPSGDGGWVRVGDKDLDDLIQNHKMVTAIKIEFRTK